MTHPLDPLPSYNSERRARQMAEFDLMGAQLIGSTRALIEMITVTIPDMVSLTYSLARYWDTWHHPRLCLPAPGPRE